MSSPRAPRSPQTPRRAGSRTPSSRLSTPRRRVAGTSERDVIPASEGNVTPRRSQASEGNVTPRRSPRRSQASDGNITPRRSQQAPSSPFHNGISEIDLSSPMNYGTPSSVGSTRSARSGGIRGTPVRPRLDVRQERRARSMSVIAENENEGIIPSQSSEADDGPEFQIWGTEVVVSKCKRKFRRFILEFVENMPAEDEISEGVDNNLPIYLQKLEEIKILEQPFLNLNCAHLEEFDPDFYSQLVRYPQDVIPTLDMAVNEIFFERYPAAVLEHQIQIRPFNSHRTKNMRALNPEDIDQLITIQGMVIRTSNLIPEIRVAFFRCIVCNFETTVDAENGFLQEPTLCSSCSTSHCFQLIHNRSEFTDKQIVKLQEPPDDIPAGQTPHTISLMCYNDLVDTVQAGERVTVTGVYRAVPVQVNPRMSVVYSVYKTFVDVVHFRKVDSNRLRVIEDGKTTKFSDERIEAIKHLASKSDIYERLARALAPSIYENIDIKKGILLQLFSGTRKNLQNVGRGKVRSEINILLCGDPGTSKSQFLSYVYDLVPRSQYTSGKGSSAVGLTAYVMKDPETKQLVLQTGALVLADNGICCIDEFDKMNDSTRSVLHEVMEQQTLSIAKAGIICQLNARTSILAAANPCESKWNAKKTIIENILLPHSLLSRFDLIFLVLDPQDEAYDRKLAWHLVSLYHRRPEEEDQDFMDMDILRDYIAYARENVHPKIGELAKTALINDYVQMRKVGSRRGLISAYPRQLESLIRLSEAHARMRLSDIVEESDVEEAWRLYREALKQSATDPLSGRVDVTILTTGQSESYRIQVEKVMKELKTIFVKQKKVGVLSYQTLFKEVKERNPVMDYPMFDKCLKNLEDERLISCMHKKSVRILQ